MKVTVMEVLRREQGLSKAALARKADVQPNLVTWVEAGRFVPYPSQLEKLADALGEPDPERLMEPVEVDANDW